MRSRPGQAHAKGGPFAGGGFDSEPSAHRFRQRPADPEAQPGALFVAHAVLDNEYVMKDDVESGLMRAIVQDVPTLDDALHVTESLLLADTETVASVEA